MLSIASCHETEYESEPDVVAVVQGRFHLLGEHTGFVKGAALSMAIDCPLYISVSPRKDSGFRFFDPNLKERKRATSTNLKFKKEDRWANAIKAVLLGFSDAGVSFKGMNFTIFSSIPRSSGLGITEALALSTALVMRKLWDPSMSDLQLLKILSTVSVFLNSDSSLADFCCGLYAQQDTLVATDYNTISHEIIPFKLDDYSIFLTDAGVPRLAPTQELSNRMRDCNRAFALLKDENKNTSVRNYSPADLKEAMGILPELMRRRAICIVDEIQRVKDACEALRKKDLVNFARIINQSHEAFRDLYEISCPEVDWLVKRAQELSIYNCSRLTGNGFGGCTFNIVKTDTVETYMNRLEEYNRIFGFHTKVYSVNSTASSKIYIGKEIYEDSDN